MEEYYYRLITDYFEKKINSESLNELYAWVDESPENLAAFRETLLILDAAKKYSSGKAGKQQSDVWKRVSATINKPNVQIEDALFTTESDEEGAIRAKYLVYITAVVMIVLSGILLNNRYLGEKGTGLYSFVTRYNPNGKRSKITLPDGSVVYLNAASRISYRKELKKLDKREVFLSGEAFFDVVRDNTRPFIVHSGLVTTTVLGTSFNIKAFKEENKVYVTVQSGKTAVSLREGNGEKFLQYLVANQKLSINVGNGNYSFKNTDASEEVSWISNRIVFSNNNLDEIARSLERWYNVKVRFTHPELTGCRFTAKFDYIPLNKLMDIFSELTGSTYLIKDNQLIINNDKCKQEDAMD